MLRGGERDGWTGDAAARDGDRERSRRRARLSGAVADGHRHLVRRSKDLWHERRLRHRRRRRERLGSGHGTLLQRVRIREGRAGEARRSG